MRFYEFASADDKLELWRVIDKSVWQELDKETPFRKTRRNSNLSKPVATTPTKVEFKRRGKQITAANALDDIDPSAQAAERLQQAQQLQISQQLKQQQELMKSHINPSSD
jgi:hypothetical protein